MPGASWLQSGLNKLCRNTCQQQSRISSSHGHLTGTLQGLSGALAKVQVVDVCLTKLFVLRSAIKMFRLKTLEWNSSCSGGPSAPSYPVSSLVLLRKEACVDPLSSWMASPTYLSLSWLLLHILPFYSLQ